MKKITLIACITAVTVFSAILAGCSGNIEETASAAEAEEMTQAGTEESSGYKDGMYAGMARI